MWNYYIERNGRIWTDANGRIMRQLPTYINPQNGYVTVRLYDAERKKKVSLAVHRLVAYEYLPAQPFPSAQVCHCDGNKLNNHVDNLRWDSPSENIKDTWRHGRKHRREAVCAIPE